MAPTREGSYAWPPLWLSQVGGALGALSRYGLMTFVDRRTLSIFRWDVFVVNVTGCFLVSLVVSALVDRHLDLTASVVVGVLAVVAGAAVGRAF
jgi:fluoride ion exporter CrcB/FEX